MSEVAEKRKRGKPKGTTGAYGPRTQEGFFMSNGKVGDVLITYIQPEQIFAYATNAGRKITTEVAVLVIASRPLPIAESITKVTILV
jgi:hypothetical protein